MMLKVLFNLFFPKLCVGCKNPLLKAETILCVSCAHQLPLTQFHTVHPEGLKNVFYGQVYFENATALFYFHKQGISQQLIHELKYRRRQEIGEYLGKWLVSEIKENPKYQNIDVVIPVPLHKKKLRQRGYNQVEKFGKVMAKYLNATYTDTVLLRVKNTKSQTFKNRVNRLISTQTVFQLSDTEALKGKHVLLIDDVITTGSTIVACAKQLQKTPNIKLSLAVMAYTEKNL